MSYSKHNRDTYYVEILINQTLSNNLQHKANIVNRQSPW